MSECSCHPPATTDAERHTLRLALLLNATMFVVGLIVGVLAQSTGLIADSLDMLADASAYALGLAAISRSHIFKAQAATLSGSLLLVLGIGVLIDVIRRGFVGSEPVSVAMIGVACLSLAVNATILILLGRFRHGEVHLRATWLFTRVDVIANLGVIVSGVMVGLTQSRYPDLIVGGAISLYVVKESLEILREAREARQAGVA